VPKEQLEQSELRRRQPNLPPPTPHVSSATWEHEVAKADHLRLLASGRPGPAGRFLMREQEQQDRRMFLRVLEGRPRPAGLGVAAIRSWELAEDCVERPPRVHHNWRERVLGHMGPPERGTHATSHLGKRAKFSAFFTKPRRFQRKGGRSAPRA
jgi:hypothetical protein